MAHESLKAFDDSFPWSLIPDHRMLDSFRQYVLHGVQQGHFLAAVLSNDLMECYRRADLHSLRLIPAWAEFLHEHCPVSPFRFHGSEKIYLEWLAVGGLDGWLGQPATEAEK